jgi:hypothetical protein
LPVALSKMASRWSRIRTPEPTMPMVLTMSGSPGGSPDADRACPLDLA